jgi:hypothetical protein
LIFLISMLLARRKRFLAIIKMHWDKHWQHLVEQENNKQYCCCWRRGQGKHNILLSKLVRNPLSGYLRRLLLWRCIYCVLNKASLLFDEGIEILEIVVTTFQNATNISKQMNDISMFALVARRKWWTTCFHQIHQHIIYLSSSWPAIAIMILNQPLRAK